ncbi:MAG: hypothetical protein PUK70_02025 [Bacteroidales bacterium]|nr:hypothetical protein [Bacteroidales bacterium]
MGEIELVIETDKISIFSPKYDGEKMTEFEKFMANFGKLKQPQLKKDFDAIIAIVAKMSRDCGTRENLFRPEGRKIKAVPLCVEQRRNKKVGTVRLYCIRISGKILIIGNGGVKRVAKFEDDQVLSEIVKQLRNIEHSIYIATRKAKVDYGNYDKVKKIIENLII